MLNQHTLDQLRGLRLDGLVAALQDPATSRAAAELDFDARLALLVQREVDWRDGKRLARLLKAAHLKVSGACMEDIDWRASRGLNRALMADLAGGNWLREGRSVLITGATGCGKTWLACALGQQAARAGHSVLYTRASRLLQELHVAHGDGSFTRRLAQLARLAELDGQGRHQRVDQPHGEGGGETAEPEDRDQGPQIVAGGLGGFRHRRVPPGPSATWRGGRTPGARRSGP